jgi:hypothetical protein
MRKTLIGVALVLFGLAACPAWAVWAWQLSEAVSAWFAAHTQYDNPYSVVYMAPLGLLVSCLIIIGNLLLWAVLVALGCTLIDPEAFQGSGARSRR